MATKQRRTSGAGTKTSGATTRTVDLPGVSAEFHPPDHYIPTRDDLAGAANTVREYLPSREMALWFGGLAALAAFAVIDWPVAAAIGAGTVIAKRLGGGSAEARSSSSGSSSE